MSHQHMMRRGQRLYHANEVVCVARGPLIDDRKDLRQVRREALLCMARCDTLDFAKNFNLTKRSPRQPGMARPAQKLLLWAA